VKTLAIIPARGGSKGVIHKNIRKLVNKPLIEYTITAALESKFINKIIVSTDDKAISLLSKSLGAEVPFLRPKKFSHDTSKTSDLISHTLDFLKKNQSYVPDIIIILQPTSPLRNSNHIDKTIKILQKTKSSSVITVKKIHDHPFASFKYEKPYLKPFKSDFEKYYQRQKFPDLYYPTGAIYAFWYNTFKKYNSVYGKKIIPLFIDDESIIDIDTPLDFFICESIIKNWNKFNQTFSKL
jgi:CMP-N,N'-diacetyllegionaminic acid synthase